MNAGVIKVCADKHIDFLRDESGLSGQAESISFPVSGEEAAIIVREMSASGRSITVRGGGTGICGAAVPFGGHVMCMTGMSRVLGMRRDERGYQLRVETGITLEEVERQLAQKSFITDGWDELSLAALSEYRQDRAYFWAVEPTEATATVGGVLATKAQGICRRVYGTAERHVESITVLDAGGRERTVVLPSEIGTYIGSEGMYGVMTEAVLRLSMRPQESWGLFFFFSDEQELFDCAEKFALLPVHSGTALLAAFEFMDEQTLLGIRELRQLSAKLKELPQVNEHYVGALYAEIHADCETDIENIALSFLEVFAAYDAEEEATWALTGENGIKKARVFRHAAAEAVNIRLEKNRQDDRRLTKLSGDMIMPGKTLRETVLAYRYAAAAMGIASAVFGHVEGNHLHVNLLPTDYEQFLRAEKLMEKWALQSLESGGSVFCEHGVGKIKKELFSLIAGEQGRQRLLSNKLQLDPEDVFNRGNMTDR